MKLDIEGTLDVTIFKGGKEVSEEEEKEVVELLNEGLLYFGLESKHITDTDFVVQYTVKFDIEVNTTYNFEL